MLLYKTLHIIFMVTWFAGLFYLPRLYVYHAQAEDQISKDRFKIIGRISMDSFTIDISKCSHDLKVGMYVDIINDEHKVDEFAKKCKTISYEVLTSIGNRVYRNYE